MVCAVVGCDSPAQAKGYCWMHFGRWRRNGDPLASGKHGGHNKGIARPAEANVPDPAPLRAVRLQLQASREDGAPFARAWREAVGGSLLIDETWADALGQTRDAWRSAYCRTGEVFRLDVLCLEPEARQLRRSAPPLTLTGARHDGPSELELVVLPWCN